MSLVHTPNPLLGEEKQMRRARVQSIVSQSTKQQMYGEVGRYANSRGHKYHAEEKGNRKKGGKTIEAQK